MAWRAIFSFVISFEISKLTSSFVNFNNLTKLISSLGMAKNQVRNISANHCARRVLGAVLKLKKYFVSFSLNVHSSHNIDSSLFYYSIYHCFYVLLTVTTILAIVWMTSHATRYTLHATQ